MARPLRIEYPGAWYHVMHKGANFRKIYSDKKDYNLFISVLKESCKLFNTFVISYCLMPKRYDILIHTPEGNLSRFMRHLNGVYTQRYNRNHKKDGPLFRGRYKAILVQEDEYSTKVVRYIHNNPKKARLVIKIKGYKWSSHNIYLEGKNKEKWLNIDPVLMDFSNRRQQAVLLYKEFMEHSIDDQFKKFYSKKNQSSILGDEGFIKKIREHFIYSDKKLNLEIKEKKRIQGEGKVEKINSEVCGLFKIQEESLYKSRRGQENIPRLMAILLSRELSGFRFPEIANLYKINSYRTVGSICFRFNNKLKENRKLYKQFITLKALCS